MSVINTMLKDLDKRQQAQPIETLPVPDVQYVAPTPGAFARLLPWALLLLLSVCGTIGATMAWQQLAILTQNNTQLEQDLQQAQLPAVNVAAQELASSEPTEAKDMNALAESQQQLPDVAAKGIDNQTLAANITTNAKANPNTDSSPHGSVDAITGDNAGRHIAMQHTSDKNRVAASEVNQQLVRQPNAAEPRQVAGAMAVKEVKLTPSALAQKRFALGLRAQNEGQLQQAQDYFSEAIGLDPSLHQARQHLAALYYGQGRLGDADSTLAQGRVLYPEHFNYALLQARLYEASGAIDKALAALATIPDADLLAVQKWTMQSHLAQQVQQFALAEQSYRQLTRVDPNQAKWWMGLAYALDSQQQFLSAKQAYRQALALDGLSASASAFIEQRLAQLGDVE